MIDCPDNLDNLTVDRRASRLLGCLETSWIFHMDVPSYVIGFLLAGGVDWTRNKINAEENYRAAGVQNKHYGTGERINNKVSSGVR